MWNPPELQNMVLLLFLTVICWMSVDSESAGSVQRNISAVEGQTVSLPCEAPNQETIRVVEWTRPDLGENPDVLSYKYGHFDRDNHRSYKNRVDLKNVKDGDVSLIMKNVAFRDSGTYKCFIAQGGESNNIKLISSISLSVVPPGDPGGQGGGGGHVGLSVGLTVAALVVVGGAVVMFLRHQQKKKSPPPPPNSDPDLDEPLNQFDS
ncbi:nectin-3-like [Salarias fasciatus]|uniref:nectin-3-like n=1 Tax=Salarias fasciatus TaxID=181472 RepID=UPI00117664AF|nr:nectin-3-like [Salarias fasciatus]